MEGNGWSAIAHQRHALIGGKRMSEISQVPGSSAIAVGSSDSYLLELAQASSLTVRIALRDAGLDASRATSLEACIQRIQEHQPKIVIMTLDRIATRHLAVIAEMRLLTRAPLLIISDDSSVDMRLVSLLARQREREWERMLELERLESLKSTLLRTVGHEVKSPITAVRAAAELLTDESIDIAPEQRRRIATTLRGGVQRLERIVEESLAFAELQAGAFSLNLEYLDMCEAIEIVVGGLRPELVAKHQMIDIITPQQPVMAKADSARIIQLLSALLFDATNRAPANTDLRVRVHEDDTGVLIELSIPGLGIAKSEQSMIFEEFYRSSEPGRAGSKASVLGLATAKKLARAHGGNIEVRSAVEGPTVFVLRLPSITRRTPPLDSPP